MMTQKRLTRILSVIVAVLAVASLLKWSSNYRARLEETLQQPQTESEEEAALMGFDRLTYFNGSATLDFLRTEEGVWVWTADQTFPLDDSTILTILEGLQNLQPTGSTPLTESPEEYDLGAAPAASVTASGPEGTLSAVFGKKSDNGGRYALLNGDDTVLHTVPEDLLTSMSVPVYDMMVLPKIPVMDPVRIDFIRVYGQALEEGYQSYTIFTAQRPEAAEGQTLTAADVTWRCSGANVSDDPDLQALLQGLSSFTIDKCLDYHPSEEAVDYCGFTAPIAALEVDFLSGGGAEQSLKLTVGSALPDGSGHYIRCGDDDPSLYRLSPAVAEPLLRIAAAGGEG